MANISNDIVAIQQAVYGEEVRGSIVNALNLMNTESSNAVAIASGARDSARNYANDCQNAATQVSKGVNSITSSVTDAENAANRATAAATAAENANTGIKDLVSNAVDKATKDAQDYAAEAKRASKEASDLAENVSDIVSRATNAANEATASATTAATAATSAVSASQSASSSATVASGAAETATNAVTTTTKNAEAAANSASQASTSETNASNSAIEAKRAAREASAVANVKTMVGATDTKDGEGGLVPAPEAGDENKALMGDGTWRKVHVDPMTGATDSNDGKSGLVPAPEAGSQDKFLRGDGSWVEIVQGNSGSGNASSSIDGFGKTYDNGFASYLPYSAFNNKYFVSENDKGFENGPFTDTVTSRVKQIPRYDFTDFNNAPGTNSGICWRPPVDFDLYDKNGNYYNDIHYTDELPDSRNDVPVSGRSLNSYLRQYANRHARNLFKPFNPNLKVDIPYIINGVTITLHRGLFNSQNEYGYYYTLNGKATKAFTLYLDDRRDKPVYFSPTKGNLGFVDVIVGSTISNDNAIVGVELYGAETINVYTHPSLDNNIRQGWGYTEVPAHALYRGTFINIFNNASFSNTKLHILVSDCPYVYNDEHKMESLDYLPKSHAEIMHDVEDLISEKGTPHATTSEYGVVKPHSAYFTFDDDDDSLKLNATYQEWHTMKTMADKIINGHTDVATQDDLNNFSMNVQSNVSQMMRDVDNNIKGMITIIDAETYFGSSSPSLPLPGGSNTGGEETSSKVILAGSVFRYHGGLYKTSVDIHDMSELDTALSNKSAYPVTIADLFDDKQNKLSDDQTNAVNSGITSEKVSKLDALPTASDLTTALAGKQNTLTTTQLEATNSGITSAKVSKLDALPTNTQLDGNLSSKANKSDITNISITGATNNTSSTILAGTLFYLNGTLCKTLVDVANGATFTLNTNYESTDIGNNFTSLRSTLYKLDNGNYEWFGFIVSTPTGGGYFNQSIPVMPNQTLNISSLQYFDDIWHVSNLAPYSNYGNFKCPRCDRIDEHNEVVKFASVHFTLS